MIVTFKLEYQRRMRIVTDIIKHCMIPMHIVASVQELYLSVVI